MLQDGTTSIQVPCLFFHALELHVLVVWESYYKIFVWKILCSNNPLIVVYLTAKIKKHTLNMLSFIDYSRKTLVSLFAILCLSSISVAQKTPIAHAHNDYEHKRPLFDALEQGFLSFEADIHLIDGELLVAHDRRETKPGRTLQSLYLDPFREQCKKNTFSFTLLIDIKTDGESTYEALSNVLKQYPDIISVYSSNKISEKPVQVIVSGNRPLELMKSEKKRLSGYDGRLEDLDSNEPDTLIPMISDNWKKHFRWRGEGEIPAEEKERLSSIVQKAHEKGRTVRFWATDVRGKKQQIKLWEELRDAGVDFINTDKLKMLNHFLNN
jgi:hypothetical protein